MTDKLVTLADHAVFWGQMLKGLNPPRTIAPGKPVRRRQRKSSVAQTLRAAAKAGVSVSRVELPDGTALVLGEAQATTTCDLDDELAAFEARHNGQDTA
jgi:hypothetical protein